MRPRPFPGLAGAAVYGGLKSRGQFGDLNASREPNERFVRTGAMRVVSSIGVRAATPAREILSWPLKGGRLYGTLGRIRPNDGMGFLK